MSQLSPETFAEIKVHSKLVALLPELEAELLHLEELVEKRVAREIADGNLTPERALQAWHEKIAYRRMRKRFRQKVLVGEAVGEEHAEELSKT